MADLLIRDLDDLTKAALQAQAKRHGRSVSAEIRYILNSAVRVDGMRNAAVVANEFFGPGTGLSTSEAEAIEGLVGEIQDKLEAPELP